MLKTPLGLLVAKWTTTSWRLNTWHVRSRSLLTGIFSVLIKMLLISTVPLLPLRVLSVLTRIPTHSLNFVLKNYIQTISIDILISDLCFSFTIRIASSVAVSTDAGSFTSCWKWSINSLKVIFTIKFFLKNLPLSFLKYVSCDFLTPFLYFRIFHFCLRVDLIWNRWRCKGDKKQRVRADKNIWISWKKAF